MNTSTLLFQKKIGLLSIILIGFTTLSAQGDDRSDFSFAINRVQKYLSITTTQLDSAQTLSDLNHHYKADWVKDYKSVEISVITNGQKKAWTSFSDKLTTKQKQAIRSADLGSDIDVLVYYLPKNNLSHNEIAEMDFTFKVDPEIEASYIGGENLFDEYIKRTIIEKVTVKDVPPYQVAAIKFTVDEGGNIVDVNIAQASTNSAADSLLLRTICDMPMWKSAQYSDGTRTKQDFVFTIGDHYSCTMNLLDIKSDIPPSSLSTKQ